MVKSPTSPIVQPRMIFAITSSSIRGRKFSFRWWSRFLMACDLDSLRLARFSAAIATFSRADFALFGGSCSLGANTISFNSFLAALDSFSKLKGFTSSLKSLSSADDSMCDIPSMSSKLCTLSCLDDPLGLSPDAPAGASAFRSEGSNFIRLQSGLFFSVGQTLS